MQQRKNISWTHCKILNIPSSCMNFLLAACRGGLKLHQLILLLFLGNNSHLDPIPSQLLSMHNNLSWPHKKKHPTILIGVPKQIPDNPPCPLEPIL